ncbi:MAG: DUF1549 domain-containing protein [Planctomycetaceae bacterium]|nr:DUF1549 domain-containing protein [Planctomycetaceae bacterium]
MTSLRLAAVLILAASAYRTAGAQEVSFRNDVMAVLSKGGCNTGTCHGNASGKGGFKLSLRGDNPDADYQTLVRDLSGRRLNLTEPDHSLLLEKATLGTGHGGGLRFRADSPEYALVRQWIAAGARPDADAAPRLVDLTVTPAERIVPLPEADVQLQAIATFSDGARRDVTTLAVYEPSSQIVDVSASGRITAERAGDVTIGVRFLNRQTPMRLSVFLPRQDFGWNPPPSTNPIDLLVFDRLRDLQIHPSPLCDDTTFLRRACLDLTGEVPTADEARDFIANADPHKRSRLVDRLLDTSAFSEFWAIHWSDLLRNEERTLDRKGVANLHAWVRTQIADNTPLDAIARRLLTARGSTYAEPAANYYRALRDPESRAEATAQVFLGLRLQCAKCHNHPFDRWTQDDYYSWGNVFAQVDYKVLANDRQDSNDKHEFAGEQIVFCKEDGALNDPRNGKPPAARLLSATESLPADTDRLAAVADWVTSPDNPWFARTQANRIFAHLFGRGLVDPVDDIRITNPAVYPELLDWLANDLVAHGFDQRHTIRTLMNSSLYQLSSEPNDTNRDDETHFARNTVRRLTAEQLLDSIMLATGADVPFNGYPPGTRARQIAGVAAIRPRSQAPSMADRFLTRFGKPPREQSCDCERSDESTLAQTFELISGPLIDDLLARPGNRIDQVLANHADNAAVIDDLYWTTLSRPPSPPEQQAALQHLNSHSNRRAAAEDLLWSLINSAEFLLRR